MAGDGRWADVELDVEPGTARQTAAPSADTPFRILIMGDFTGRGSRGAAAEGPALAARRPVRVDRDDFDTVLARLAPEIALTLDPGERITMRITDIDDFHPDRLYGDLPRFQRLRALRARVANPATFQDAARELLGAAAESPAPAPRVAPGRVLDAILGEPLEAAPVEPLREDDLQAMIRRIVAPHLVAATDPRQPDLLAKVDAAITEEMRSVLHHPAFQAVESLWRALWLLVRRVDTSETLQLHILDLSARELVTDLATPGDLERSALHRVLVDESVGTPGAAPWSLIVTAFTFGWDDDDLAVLGRLAALGRRAGAAVVAGAAPRLAGCPSFDRVPDMEDWSTETIAAWELLRRDGDAAHLGLVAPRFLVRAPYGERGEACEQFRFEELGTPAIHGDFLWANGALAVALLMGEAFAEDGWNLRLGSRREIGGLPLHLVADDGGMRAQPCAEALLTERAAARMMERGLMPLASVKDRDAVLLVRFQSIAAPLAALAGPWTAVSAR